MLRPAPAPPPLRERQRHLLRAGCSGGRPPSLGRRGQSLSLVRGAGWALSGWPPWTGQMRGAVRHPPSPGPWPRGLAGLLELLAEGCGSRSCHRVAGPPSLSASPSGSEWGALSSYRSVLRGLHVSWRLIRHPIDDFLSFHRLSFHRLCVSFEHEGFSFQ